MVKLYVKKILANELTIEDVPVRWRAQVEEELAKLRGEE